MKNYVGRKCKGFRFEDGTDGLEWNPMMRHHIKEVGVIEIQYKNSVRVQFEGYNWSYPISLIEPYLIPETPEIPQLGEGVEMEVSDDNEKWYIKAVIAQMQDGLFVTNDNCFLTWKYARPIQEVKKYTKEDLVKILGHDFEII
jgi:hypothetical protein